MRYPVRIAAAAVIAIVAPTLKPAFAASTNHSWSGCYTGVHAGGLWGKTDNKIDGSSTASYQNDVRVSAATAGAHAGCNYQVGVFVLGAEGDLNWAPVDDNVRAFSGGPVTRRAGCSRLES